MIEILYSGYYDTGASSIPRTRYPESREEEMHKKPQAKRFVGPSPLTATLMNISPGAYLSQPVHERTPRGAELRDDGTESRDARVHSHRAHQEVAY